MKGYALLLYSMALLDVCYPSFVKLFSHKLVQGCALMVFSMVEVM